MRFVGTAAELAHDFFLHAQGAVVQLPLRGDLFIARRFPRFAGANFVGFVLRELRCRRLPLADWRRRLSDWRGDWLR